MTDQPDPKEIAALLRKPEGEKGLKMAELLNDTNRYITEFTYLNVNPKNKQTILEIGFGNGKLMPELLSKAEGLKLIGVDFSEDMVAEGKRILCQYIENGEIELYEASVESLPFREESFDSVCSINTLYFWPDPVSNVQEILRVLKPGAKVYLGIRPKEEAEKLPATKYGFQLYSKDEAMGLLEQAGFENVELMEQTDLPVQFNGESKILRSWVFIGQKPV
ncbi:class I SAM-dependent methyltransferase [Cytophagaceae bacterium ABcell3]|nr:class I SAM-dependent methyltransferase [Cytophagaceae bacterium ABcell3]